MAAFSVFVDGNANGIYDPAVDTGTFVDELPADAYATVFIVATAPAVLTDGYTAAYTLTATGATAGTPTALGADAVATNGANGLLGVDIAFADTAGFGGVDAALDGKHTDASDFLVSAPVISLSKTVAIADPYGSTNAIPGATATYTLTISNTGTASAVLSSIGDPIDPSLTLTGVASWALSSGGGAALVADLNDANADGLGFAAGPPVNLTYTITTFLSNPNTTVPRAAPGELKAGETLTLTFAATIN